MTEDEARKKWCPFVRGTTTHATGVNRGTVGGAEAAIGQCIGSACMAWRTASVGRVLPGDEYPTYRDESYCGLAGPVQ